IQDSLGNRIILDGKEITRIVPNEPTDNQRKRAADISQTDELTVGEQRTEGLGKLQRKVRGDQTVNIDGNLTEKVHGGGYKRTISPMGTEITHGGELRETVRGQSIRKVTGRSQETATGGWSVSAGRGLSMTSLGS